MILDRFGQEHHELLIRQLFQIRQTGTVQEYISKFKPLVDQLNAYGTTTDPLFYTMRFIDGLKDYIRIVVAMHRPQIWDTACILAKLQEDVAEPTLKRDYRRYNPAGARQYYKPAVPLPAPPPRLALPAPELKQAADGARHTSVDDRLAALRSARRAQGLCMRCGSKWSRDHRCPQAVQLNVVQELLDALQLEDSEQEDLSPTESAQEQVFLTLSVAVVTRVAVPRTMCF